MYTFTLHSVVCHFVKWTVKQLRRHISHFIWDITIFFSRKRIIFLLLVAAVSFLFRNGFFYAFLIRNEKQNKKKKYFVVPIHYCYRVAYMNSSECCVYVKKYWMRVPRFGCGNILITICIFWCVCFCCVFHWCRFVPVLHNMCIFCNQRIFFGLSILD